MRACFYILILLTVLVQTQAQTLLIPEKLTIEDGLAQGFVSAIHQDQEGFLWFGTKNGLNRYDGRQFEKFTHNPDDLYSIAGDWVQTILEEGDFLIVSGHGDQLNLFHKRTKNFYSIPLNVNGVEYFSGILSVVKDIKEQYWITTNNSQVIRVTFPDQFWKQLPMQAELLAKVKIELVLKGYSVYNTAKDSNFLVLNIPKNLQIDINTLDTSTSNINDSYAQFRFFQPLTEHLRLGQSIVSPIELFSIYRFKEGIWNPILSDFSFLPYTYYDPSEDLVWLQRHDDNSLLAYKPDVLFNTRKITENQAAYLIKDVGIGIRKLYKDRSNILWVGTAGLGVIKISPRKLAVKNYLQGNSIKQQIFSFREGGLFFPMNKIEGITDTSTNTKVVNRFIDQIKPFKSFWLDEGFDQRWLAVVLKNSNLGAILRLYHYKDGKLNQKIQLPLSTVWFESELSMLLSKDRKLYISFSNYFIQYDPVVATHQTFQYKLFQQVVPIGFYIAQTANKNFWIGTSEGLIQVQAKQDSFDFQLITAGLRNKACASLLVDPNDANILWIGTKGGGLHRLDTKTMEFEHLYTQNGLPNNVIYGVLNDEEGNLWMSSNKGIINYHPRTGDIRNFTSADGMQSDEFNTFAFGKAMDGALMFGGINGLNIFYPKDLKGNPHTPAVKITGLAINNEPVSVLDSTNILETTIEFTDNITLNYSQNNITLDFAALEFTAPSKNTFSYYLEGAEAAWSHTTTDNSATYLNLAPGNYTFKIKAANGDLVWSEKVTTLDISIRPPWYRSTLAYGCYFLLLGFIFWWSRQLQRRRLQLKYSLELEQKEAERLKELDRFRSRLYTNITHEFRTPLTVILGTSEQMQAQKHSNHPEQRQLSLIRRNGKNLLNLVNQMLDLSKIEHNKLRVNYQQGDVLSYLRYLTESYYSLANSRNVLLKIESNQPKIYMDYDAEKMRQIISNLLSNAIKYTSSGGKVLLSVAQEADQLKIEVKDTGSGIAPADLPHIFERYYQADDEVSKAGGTGIGLALTRELVKLLDGNINVESELGKGTTFTVVLPIRQQAPLQETVPLVEEVQIASANIEGKSHLQQVPKLLLIEDNLDVVEYITSCLEHDYELVYAYNGQAGIDRALELTPDLIVSDVMMPEKTGFEVTNTLKKDERTSHIPIVLLTAKADMESRLAGLKRGADVYLQKPFHPEELLVNLANLLALRQKLQAKYQQLALATDEPMASLVDDPEQTFLQKVRQYLAAELGNPNLKATDVAKALGMSRSNLYAKLSAVTGMSFNIYLRTLRLQKAKELLQTTSLTVSEVAYQVGFNRLNYFSEQFTKQFGVSPSGVRRESE